MLPAPPMPRLYGGSCLETISSSRFWMRHIIRINTPGKIISIIAGIAIASGDREPAALRILAIVNAACMVGGTLWYSRYWDTPSAVEAFLLDHREHALSRSPLRPAGVMILAAIYYYVFAVLFVHRATTLASPTWGFRYAVAMFAWHGWCGVILTIAAVLQWGRVSTHENDPLISVAVRTDEVTVPRNVGFRVTRL